MNCYSCRYCLWRRYQQHSPLSYRLHSLFSHTTPHPSNPLEKSLRIIIFSRDTFHTFQPSVENIPCIHRITPHTSGCHPSNISRSVALDIFVSPRSLRVPRQLIYYCTTEANPRAYTQTICLISRIDEYGENTTRARHGPSDGRK